MPALLVNPWRTRLCAWWLARAWPVWTRASRARVAAALNAAMRMAWLISFGWMSRTCCPGLTWARGSRAGNGPVGALGGAQVGLCRAEVCGEPVVVGVGDQHRLVGGQTASSRAASVAARARSYLARAPSCCLGSLLGWVGDQLGRVILRGGRMDASSCRGQDESSEPAGVGAGAGAGPLHGPARWVCWRARTAVLGVTAGFPIFPQKRTYSFGATVIPL